MRSAHLAIATAIALAALGGALGNTLAQGPEPLPAQDPPPAATPAPPVTMPPAPTPPEVKDIVPQPSGRFSLSRVEGGFLRLDSVTGHMSFCSPHTVGWACQAVPEDRLALDAEIARLQRELGKLKDEIAKAQIEPAPPRPPGDIPPQAGQGADKDQNQTQSQDDTKLRLPSREEMERARAALDRAWKHLVEMISEFQKDLTRKD